MAGPWAACSSQARDGGVVQFLVPGSPFFERVFSRVKSHFTTTQMVKILNDYVETAVMLDYNDRDVAAAWY